MSHPAVRSSTTASQLRNQAHCWLALTITAILLAGCVMRTYPPEAWAFYPVCPFHQWTGLLCPGCGGTRALAALARGHFREAMRYNALVVIALAACFAWFVRAYARALRGRQPVWPTVPLPALMAAWSSTLIFAVARNLT